MVFLIAGAPHTGKTDLAQRLLEKYGFPYLSVDHLKMGLVRSGNIVLPPTSSDRAMEDYLWPILREIVKTVLENRQNLIVEGGCIPFDWQRYFSEEEVRQIKYRCLVMTEDYIRGHYHSIHPCAGEHGTPLGGMDCSLEELIRDNQETLALCRRYGADYLLIDGSAPAETDL